MGWWSGRGCLSAAFAPVLMDALVFLLCGHRCPFAVAGLISNIIIFPFKGQVVFVTIL